MGTNFYARHIPTVKEHAQMEQLLAEKQYQKLRDVLDDSIAEYHIGKYSCGWQFLFQASSPNEWEDQVPWESTLHSIATYLDRDDVEIYDEYGTHYSSKEFWERVGDALHHDDEHINLEDYYKKHPDEKSCNDNSEFEINGIRFCNRWFE